MDDRTVSLEGEVLRIVFTNPENHWTVVRLSTETNQQTTTVVGAMAGIREGERLRVWGRWVDDRRFGRQLKVHRYEVLLPATATAIERYLGSGVVAGVGPKTAQLLVRRFGEKTLEVIDRNPERLRQVKGIGKKRLSQLLKSWKENASIRRVMVFLQGLGVSPALAIKIHKEYGSEAIGRVRANPYDLAHDVWGVGFLKADNIAKQMGIRDDDPARLRAGLIHVLTEARSQGHVCLPTSELLAAGESLLTVPEELLSGELSPLELAGRIICEPADDLVYIPELHRAERYAAKSIMRLLDAPALQDDDSRISLVRKQAELTLGLELSQSQSAAVEVALKSRISVITGGPGTGKTTIVRAVVEAMEMLGHKVALCAPTGRASKRLSLATAREAKTIHRLLEWQPQEATFARDEYNPVAADCVIVDEVSMVDLLLFEKLLKAMSDGARVLLVGDVDQLPSVGPGAVLRNIIDSKVVTVVRLTDIYRQAAGSLIVTNAHRMLSGQLPKQPDQSDEQADFYWVERDDPEGILAIMRKLIQERMPAAFDLDPRRDVQVLTPMHRGALGAEGLNSALGELLNPRTTPARFAAGDKVMQIRNNYDKEVFNGDVGFIDSVAADGRTLLVRYEEPSPRLVPYEPAELDELVMAWAITIHKSQGSEYPAVVVPLHTQHFMMLRRNLIYTAVTRGKRLVVLIGSRKALGLGLRESTVRPRYGRLSELLEELAR